MLPLLLLTRAFAEGPAALPCGGFGIVPRDGTVLARVDGVPVTQELVDATLAQLPEATRASIAKNGQLDQVREQVVVGELLYAEACRRMAELPGARLTVAMAERDALDRALLDVVVGERATPARIAAWYQEHLVQFAHPQVMARHILVKEKSQAVAVLARLRGGEPFDSVARAVSVDTASAVQGGELGWFPKDRMVQEFADAAFGAQVGELVGPIQTKFGWHVILVEGKRDVTPLAEVEPKIRAQLRTEILEEYIDELKATHVITQEPAAQ
jgi:peptidyl-prolyl cis-trans isomerase C